MHMTRNKFRVEAAKSPNKIFRNFLMLIKTYNKSFMELD